MMEIVKIILQILRVFSKKQRIRIASRFKHIRIEKKSKIYFNGRGGEWSTLMMRFTSWWCNSVALLIPNSDQQLISPYNINFI